MPTHVSQGLETYDTLAAHQLCAGELHRAALPMGMLLAWCANMRLLSGEFEQAHARQLLRLRMQEFTGAELLIYCGGDLERAWFSEQGTTFLDQNYVRCMSAVRAELGEDPYSAEDTWDNYQRVAKVLTAQLMGRPGRSAVGTTWLQRAAQRVRGLWH